MIKNNKKNKTLTKRDTLSPFILDYSKTHNILRLL